MINLTSTVVEWEEGMVYKQPMGSGSIFIESIKEKIKKMHQTFEGVSSAYKHSLVNVDGRHLIKYVVKMRPSC